MVASPYRHRVTRIAILPRAKKKKPAWCKPMIHVVTLLTPLAYNAEEIKDRQAMLLHLVFVLRMKKQPVLKYPFLVWYSYRKSKTS